MASNQLTRSELKRRSLINMLNVYEDYFYKNKDVEYERKIRVLQNDLYAIQNNKEINPINGENEEGDPLNVEKGKTSIDYFNKMEDLKEGRDYDLIRLRLYQDYIFESKTNDYIEEINSINNEYGMIENICQNKLIEKYKRKIQELKIENENYQLLNKKNQHLNFEPFLELSTNYSKGRDINKPITRGQLNNGVEAEYTNGSRSGSNLSIKSITSPKSSSYEMETESHSTINNGIHRRRVTRNKKLKYTRREALSEEDEGGTTSTTTAATTAKETELKSSELSHLKEFLEKPESLCKELFDITNSELVPRSSIKNELHNLLFKDVRIQIKEKKI
ncbi:hypothetical protein TBLA_0B06030 [Henningerozyma blattae CBS 6284]|uniref:Transcriptional regulatory protein SDS3 n=1 Tax=Henningerozyma blattae (strain ATCC 34711 / CBS 6284 / DSM 70876 / NBRC 10599 / NRRL Y-10934 / UCD 77-7) TaxID=1071380 RepID=I2GZ77_HENB6|nr:hypothetical protein TBLA_0B06030 [Tetrapisispora blattae CBS 6284]CCH59429.1 hypothetical protein TBLA_0B06030 [Tetrapisispora blattae CBS 6284]